MNLHIVRSRTLLTVGTALTASAVCAAPASAPPMQIGGFFAAMTGEWIGTVQQYTSGTKAPVKYFHASISQTGPSTYLGTFQYYQFDPRTHAPVPDGSASMTSTVAPNGTATNAISGTGDILVDPKTSKHEDYLLSEILHMTGPASTAGTGTGKINISGTTMNAGHGGRVSDYNSVWALDNGALNISERLKVTFHVLFVSKHYDIANDFSARRGSSVADLMR